jgi:hypothetical protein
MGPRDPRDPREKKFPKNKCNKLNVFPAEILLASKPSVPNQMKENIVE